MTTITDQPAAIYDTSVGTYGERLSREVRLTWAQTQDAQGALRRRARELRRKIKTARDASSAGHTIQHGTLAAHERELENLTSTIAILEAADEAMSRRASDLISDRILR